MNHLKSIVKEYQEQFIKQEIFEDNIYGEIKRIEKALLDEKFLPSTGLKILFNKLLRRSKYPMEVAIVGQFSSGKSTFLNALLSKDILPTGITPVTSKVNFINYADEYKLKVSYKNGINEYHALETIADFTDQRKSTQDIKYLTLYAPMDILKDISFVDTPGLNSQSLSDTQSTKNILRDVDGIIWLTLIDNAGKESEAEILKEYLDNFKDKSLCVLNQKDKFNTQDIEKTLQYIKSQFSDFFSDVIPISSKDALDSRVNQKDVLIDNALHSLEKAFKKSTSTNINENDLSFFKDDYAKFVKEIDTIKTKDSSNDKILMENSNISEVLDYIEQKIRPQAKASKIYAIRKDLNSICDILIKEYETILGVHESLEEILLKKESMILESFDNVYTKHSKTLVLIFEQIESIMHKIADTIYENITTKETKRYEHTKAIFSKENIKSHTYETVIIDIDSINKKLFLENKMIDKQVEAVVAHLKSVEQLSSQDFMNIFKILKDAIVSWQKPYELIKKHREIASDLEFANTRQEVAKVYENIILSYHRSILGNISALHKKYAYFNGAFSHSYTQIIQKSILQIQNMLNTQKKLFEKNPLEHNIDIPNFETILEILKDNFDFEKIEVFLVSRRNYLYKTLEISKTQFLEINTQQIRYVISKKELIIEKIRAIKEIQITIDRDSNY